MIYKKAFDLAKELTSRIIPLTHVCRVAGSVRREKQEVKDLEIVCVPHLVNSTQQSMFDNAKPVQVVSPNFVKLVTGLGKVIKGKPDGRYMQIELQRNFNLDLFMPDPVDFYRQFVIRTGSVDYVRSTVTKAWLAKGWCGSDQGLRKISDCQANIDLLSNKRLWTCINPHAERPPAWESEAHFLNWVGLEWIMPKLRII